MFRKIESISRHRWLVPAVALLALTAVLGAGTSSAQTGALALHGERFELDRLAPGLPQGEARFVVDDATTIMIDIAAPVGDLETSIEVPDGQVIDAPSIAAFGGTFTTFEGSGTPDSALLTSVSEPGFHYIYTFPSLGPGTYIVRFVSPQDPADETPITTRLSTDSPVLAGLIATNPIVTRGDLAVLTAAIFETASPVLGATAQATVRDPNGVLVTLELLDNGLDADHTAGDGLYSGEIETSIDGSYGAVADLSGTTALGAAFVRQVAARFEVVSPTSRLLGTFVDSGLDDDGDGLFDRLHIDADTDTVLDGDYRVFVALRAAGGATVQASGAVSLGVGGGSVGVDFTAAEVSSLGEDGPWSVESAELVLLGTEGARRVDRLVDLGPTQAFTLDQFARPPLRLTGAVTDQGIDDDGNGRFDRLLVSVEIEVLRSGFYSWSYKLTDANANEIEFGSSSGFLAAGLVPLPVTFDGETIGDSGANGPYLLRDLLMFGSGASLVEPLIGQTAAYDVGQFEGADVVPPEISVSVDPDLLWPPNHRMVEIAATVMASDDLDPSPTVTLVAVLSDEEDDAMGDGSTTEDIQDAEIGTDDRAFALRAERSGTGDGRVYTIVYQARDFAGNVSEASTTVVVPLNRSDR